MRLTGPARAGLAPTGVLAPGVAEAHGGSAGAWAAAWGWALPVLGLLAWAAYVAGAARVRPRPRQRWAWHAALGMAGVALLGPLDQAAARSTAAHMVQHMVLIVGVAPLLVIAQPLPQWHAACGPAAVRLARGPLALARAPMAAAGVHAAALWFWHAPGPYTAALRHESWHVLEHASFVSTAWVFWWAVMRCPASRSLAALGALLFTLMHTGLLGALLTFAPRPLYLPESRDLMDQQLAGLLMWVPGALAYLAACALVARRALTHRTPPGSDAGGGAARR